MNVHIREAQVEDAEAITDLIVGAAKFFLAETSGKEAEDFFGTVSAEAMRRRILDPSFQKLVAIVEGEMAGVLVMQENGHLYHLFVGERYHRQGLARQMWDRAREDAMAAGNPGTFTLNSTLYAVSVYESLGFRATGERVRKYGAEFVAMRLE